MSNSILCMQFESVRSFLERMNNAGVRRRRRQNLGTTHYCFHRTKFHNLDRFLNNKDTGLDVIEL
jgi:hypothetical protein